MTLIRPLRTREDAQCAHAAQPHGLWVAVSVLVTAASMWALTYAGPSDNVTPDTQQYAYQTLLRLGVPDAAAYEQAHRWYCARQQDPEIRPSLRRCLQKRAHPRFQAIFAARPGWILLAAPLVAVMGLSGLMVLTFICGVVAGSVVYVAVRELGGGHHAGLASIVLLYLLPSGHWLTQAIPEGLVLAALVVCGIGAHRLVGGRTGGAALLIGGLAAVHDV
jgi:hypothetical protein